MPRKSPRLTRERLTFPDRNALERAAGRLLADPVVESCSIDLPNLLVEVGLAAHMVQRQQQVSDWRRRYRAAVR